MKALSFSFFVCLIALLSACSSTPVETPLETTPQTKSIPLQPEALISKALRSETEQQQTHYFFQAALAYWNNNLLAQSDAALGSVQTQFLTEEETQQYLKMVLTLATENENLLRIEKALELLPAHGYPRTSVEQQVQFAALTAKALELVNRNIEAAIVLIDNRGLLNEEELLEVDEKIWQLLRSSETAKLSQYTYSGDNLEALAWLDLARTIQLNQINLDSQYQALLNWSSLWPDHPASLNPPHELKVLQQLPSTRPDSITLALPLSGPLQSAGKAIRDGFMASYYANSSMDPSKEPMAIRFYDTAKHDILALYEDEQDIKSSLIIGPLDKTSLNALNSLDEIDTPTLALNYLSPDSRLSSNLYQLGLAPESEATQLAEHLNKKGLRRVGIILPENNLGFRVYDAFTKTFSSLDGVVVQSSFYKDQSSLSSSVADLLGTSESQTRKKKIQQITGQSLEFLPRRRQDIDALIMIAKPEIARQIKPLFAFHYAADLPVFASSQVHNPSANGNNRDLDGIEFIEMPWMLSSTIDTKSQILKSIPESGQQYTRFYALGADSFNIAPRLKLLREVQGSQMQGHTGTLSMNSEGIVSRKMEWAKFRKGKASIIKE